MEHCASFDNILKTISSGMEAGRIYSVPCVLNLPEWRTAAIFKFKIQRGRVEGDCDNVFPKHPKPPLELDLDLLNRPSLQNKQNYPALTIHAECMTASCVKLKKTVTNEITEGAETQKKIITVIACSRLV